MSAPTVGILAGMGPRSTGPFLELVLNECERQYGARHDSDFPSLMIHSLPTPFYPDRPIDHPAMEAALLAGLERLVKAGSSFVAIACNTAHVYRARLLPTLPVPLLDMIALATAALPATARRIALLAARPTVEAKLYRPGIAQHGAQLVDVGPQEDIDELIAAARDVADPAYFHGRWNVTLTRARAAGADTLLIACTDLSARRAHLPRDLVTVDATRCLAREVVRRWLAGSAGRLTAASAAAPDSPSAAPAP
jgi:aspartate racemase